MIHDSNTPATDVQDVANENQAESHFQPTHTPRTPTPRTFEESDVTPFRTDVTPFRTHFAPVPRTFEGKLYYHAVDVAQILGISKRTVQLWNNTSYFDCPLFPADLKTHDGRLLYEVERVMQLKSVYHPNWIRGGTPGNGQVTDYQKVKLPMPREFNGKKYYGAADVAKIIGVSKKTVWQWQNDLYFDCPLFTADERAHDGRYLYEVERVMQLKSVYHPNWTRGGYEISPTTEVSKMKVTNQRFMKFNFSQYLPTEFLAMKRFFPVGTQKENAPKGWSNPKNQLLFDEAFEKSAVGNVGFDTSGHGVAPDYLFLDFDHVLDDNGEFVNAAAQKWFLWIRKQLGGYCERSISGHGIHIFGLPTAGKFPRIVNKKGEGVLYFDEANDVKLEIFYKTAGRYCLLTGNLFDCEAGASIAEGVVVDNVLETLLAQIKPPEQSLLNGATAAHSHNTEKISLEVEELKNRINTTVTPADLSAKGYLQRSKNGAPEPTGYICPWCRSGTHEHKTGALTWYEVPNPHFACHAHGCGGDVIKFLSQIYGIDNRGANYFSLIRKAADDFGIPYNPEIFEVKKMNQPTNQVTLPDDTPEYVKAGIKSFETENGKINPDVIPKICAAAQKIDALNVSTLTATDVVDFAFIGSLATLKFYLPTRHTEFIEQYKNLDKPPLPASTLESKVKDCERKRKKEHRKYCKAYRQQQQADEAAARLSARNQATADNLKKIAKLYQQPQSPERDRQIVEYLKATVEWKLDKQGEPVSVKPTAANFRLIFSYDPTLKGLFARDNFQGTIVLKKNPPWKQQNNGNNQWTDSDDSELFVYLRETYTEISDEAYTRHVVVSFARENEYHPIQQYFENLPKWDGVPRAEKYFVNLLFADDNAYTHEVTMKWLLGLVARVYHPGCNFPWALVLQGAQGIGKSRSIHLLGGKWHKVLSYSVDDPHAVDALKNTWIVELEEFAAVRKSELNAMKSFISRSADNQRAAYARRAEDVPRQCGFVGTVNDTEIYTDRTGNRRFVTVRCHRVKDDCFEAPPKGFIAQVWAEVYARYNEMFADGFDVSKLELSDETKRISEDVAQEYMRDDGLDGQIAAFLNMKIPPQVIWDLFSRDEKRQFCAGGGVLETSQSAEDFVARREALGGRKSRVLADVEEIRRILENNRRYARPIQRYNSQWLAIYGTEYRKRVCAIEIGNEAFKDDSRRLTLKINEILPTLKGWHEGTRDQNYPCYGNQRHVYYRDDDNTPADDDNAPAQPLTAPVGCDSPDDKFDLSQFDRD